jgi:hypothetical protein
MLNNFSAKHFKTLARDSAKLDVTLKDLTKKLSKLTHKSAPPGSATTQNASTVQNPGVHELFVHKLSGLSGQIQNVRRDHLAEYTKVQKDVDRTIARSLARCSRQHYGFLGDALIKTGGAEAMGGVNAWGIYANAGISPLMIDLDNEGGEGDVDDEWEPSQDEDEEGVLSPRQLAQGQLPRPPTSFSDYSFIHPESRSKGTYPTLSMNMQGKMPSRGPSHASFQPYPSSQQSQQYQLHPGSSQQLPNQPFQTFQPVRTPHCFQFLIFFLVPTTNWFKHTITFDCKFHSTATSTIPTYGRWIIDFGTITSWSNFKVSRTT